MSKLKWNHLWIIAAIAVVGYFSLTFWVKHKIKQALQNEVTSGQLTYNDMYLNIFKGQLRLDSLRYQSGKNVLSVKRFEVKGISVLGYGFRFVLAVDNVKLTGVDLKLHPKVFSTKHNRKIPFDFPVEIHQLQLDSVSVEYQSKGKSQFNATNYTVQLSDVLLKPQEKSWAQRLQVKGYTLKGEQLFYRLNTLQFMRVDSVKITPKNAQFYHLKLDSDYTPQTYVKVISTERDLMHLELPLLSIKNYRLAVFDTLKKFEADTIHLEKPVFNVYRDKLVKDDLRPKYLYSRMLRELLLQLAVNAVTIAEGKITYRERQERSGKTGKVFFDAVNVTAGPFDNRSVEVKSAPETDINISAQFMGEAPLQVKWRFKIADKTDAFRIFGSGRAISATGVNSFLTPAFNLRMKGNGIETLFFDYEGNAAQAHGHFKMSYNQLKIEVLKKNGKQRNKLLSAIANIFVDKNRSQSREQVQVTTVKRDKTKSFWNYFWNCIFSGLKKSML